MAIRLRPAMERRAYDARWHSPGTALIPESRAGQVKRTLGPRTNGETCRKIATSTFLAAHIVAH
jgi:hypothetical protein